jgi:hypothetical protein
MASLESTNMQRNLPKLCLELGSVTTSPSAQPTTFASIDQFPQCRASDNNRPRRKKILFSPDCHIDPWTKIIQSSVQSTFFSPIAAMRRYTLTVPFVMALAVISASRAADESSPAKPPKVSDKELWKPGPLPDRIILTWTGDPAHSQAVTWRTAPNTYKAQAQYVKAANGNLGSKNVQQVAGKTTPFESDLGLAHYHTARFENLLPDTKYMYRVGDGTNWSEWFQFQTASTRQDPFSFLYVGDAQVFIKEHWSRLVRQGFMAAPDARFIVHAGDLINRVNNDAEWGEWHYAGGWINAMIPTVPTPGNHEYSRDKLSLKRPVLTKHWAPQFALPQNGPQGLEGTAYFIDFQGTRIISLNSNVDPDLQTPWLDSVLRDNPHTWTIVTFHHPIYSGAKNRDNARIRSKWQPLFDRHRVDLVLTGHDHTYARSGLVLSAEDAGRVPAPGGRNGTIYVVSVSGGKFYSLDPQDWMKRSIANTQLFQVIRVDGRKLRFETRTTTGDLFDQFELRKRPDDSNQLVEREQLALESRPMGTARSPDSLLAVGGLFGLTGILLVVRQYRRLIPRG